MNGTLNQISESNKKLGQLLVERGRVSGEQLLRAIQSQRAVGGRLGTCLLEMDAVTEDHLLDTLAEQLRVPAVRIEQLRGIPEDILDLIPAKVAARCQAIPFSVDGQEIDVATLNVDNLGFLDELAFCTNRKIRPHIANEARIYEALERYYGVDCPRRYTQLIDRLNRSRYLWDEGAKLLLGANLDETTWGESLFEPIEFEADDILTAPASRSPHVSAAASNVAPPNVTPRGAGPAVVARPAAIALPSERATDAAQSGSPAGGMTLKQLDQLYERQVNAEGVARCLLDYLAQHFTKSAIFKIHDHHRAGHPPEGNPGNGTAAASSAAEVDCAIGWMGRGDGLDERLLRAVMVNFREPSVFLNLKQGALYHFGPLPPMPAHRQVVRSWGGSWPAACLLMPVKVRDRAVMVFYGDRGSEPLHDLSIEEWQSLAAMTSDALELCILRKKLQAN